MFNVPSPPFIIYAGSWMNGQIIHAAQPPLLCVTDTSASLVLNQYDFDGAHPSFRRVSVQIAPVRPTF